MRKNLCKYVLDNGGKLIPLMIPSEFTGGTGLMNPSLYKDGEKIYANVRHINYILYHSEGAQLFQNIWGPLAYLNPENDIRLATTNYFCELDKDLKVQQVYKVDTTKLDVKPVWEFHGLEDCRIVKWNDKLYLSGVRRDVKENGEGRIELSEIEMIDGKVKEVSRVRIPAPNPDSYCEKNWMPVVDMPYHWVKWTNPTEVVKYNTDTNTIEVAHLGSETKVGYNDFRGSSQVLDYKGNKLAVVHEVVLFKNKLGQKDAYYYHRLILWDKDWNIIKMSDNFSFMDGAIEFSAGAIMLEGELVIAFGFQDNAAYLLKIPEKTLDNLLDNGTLL